jgi:hypothetical protein
MALTELPGIVFVSLLLGGHLWGMVDLFARIRKQPHRPLDILRLSPYPLVPSEQPQPEAREGNRTGGGGGLRLSPVPVDTHNQPLG